MPARLGLMAVVAALTLDLVAIVLDLERLRRLRGGATLETVGLDVASQLSDAANLALPLAVLVAGATFGWWFWCSYRRLEKADRAERSSMWAVLGWAVPLVNLVRPPSIMRELAVARHASLGPGAPPALVSGWWGLWLVGAITQVGLRLVRPETNMGWSIWFWVALVADVLLIGAAGCVLTLISTVDDRLRRPIVPRPNGSSSKT